jgi:hypothetical protein
MSIAVTVENFVIKFSGKSYKTVRVAYYSGCFSPEVYAWGKTSGKPSLRVLRTKIKQVLIKAGLTAEDATREARAQGRHMRTAEAKRLKKMYFNRERF